MSFCQSVNNFIFYSIKYIGFRDKESVFAGNFTALLFKKKSAAEVHKILVETYSDHALSETTCRDCLRRFKNNEFDVEDKESFDVSRKFEDEIIGDITL